MRRVLSGAMILVGASVTVAAFFAGANAMVTASPREALGILAIYFGGIILALAGLAVGR